MFTLKLNTIGVIDKMYERLPNLVLEHYLMDTQGLDETEAWLRVIQDYDDIRDEYVLWKADTTLLQTPSDIEKSIKIK